MIFQMAMNNEADSLKLKRSRKRKTQAPTSKIVNWGMDKQLNKIDRIIEVLERRN